ncbi:MAG: cofactor-independent phosphoglycerate mutase [Chloroflexota bacterium]
MKYAVVIMDGASGWPVPEHGGKTSLELARTPNLDALTAGGMLGQVRTVPQGMEASSACACMSVLGYNPRLYYKGRAAIEARSLGVPVDEGEAVFRCNLVNVRRGVMVDYSAGHITTPEARDLITALNAELGGADVEFYPGVSYRHLLKLRGHEETLKAICTPPHDIPEKPVLANLPRGTGSEFLRDLMARSEAVLRDHPVNRAREGRGELPATTIWLFWGAGPVPEMPPFRQVYGLDAALTSGVDLLRGLAKMATITILEIPGVTDGADNDYAAQAIGALEVLATHDLVVVHVEAPDEAAHGGDIEGKVAAIERIDDEIIGRLRSWQGDSLRLLVLPDHPTPIPIPTHYDDPVPFLLWGEGFRGTRGKRFSEAEAEKAGIFLRDGYKIMGKLVDRDS